jgi:hypothetical protein
MTETPGWHTPFRAGWSMIGNAVRRPARRLKHCLGRSLHWRLACHALLSYSDLRDLV